MYDVVFYEFEVVGVVLVDFEFVVYECVGGQFFVFQVFFCEYGICDVQFFVDCVYCDCVEGYFVVYVVIVGFG